MWNDFLLHFLIQVVQQTEKISSLHIFTLEFIEFLCEDGKDGNPCELSNSDE